MINPIHIRMSDPVDGVVTLSYHGLSVDVPAASVALNTDPWRGDNRAQVHTACVEALEGALALAYGEDGV